MYVWEEIRWGYPEQGNGCGRSRLIIVRVKEWSYIGIVDMEGLETYHPEQLIWLSVAAS